jgi:hypothetical protein
VCNSSIDSITTVVMSLLISSKRQKRVSVLHQLVNEVRGNEWNKVLARVRSNPEEVSSLGVLKTNVFVTISLSVGRPRAV